MWELSVLKVLRRMLSLGMVMLSANAAMAQDLPRVIAVNKALHDFAERLLGDTAEVVFPVPDGVDPSFWRPSIADISMIQSADLILLNGAGFATWVDRVSLSRSRIVNTSAAIKDQFIVTESITHSHGDGGEHSHEGLASYTWLDPTLAIAQAEAIASAVIARDLAPEKAVEANLASLTAELRALDATAQDALGHLEGTTIIATHPRYHYFARRYGLTITSLEWEAGAVPSSDDLAELTALLAQVDAKVLIWEAEPQGNATQLTEELGLHSVIFEPWAGIGTGESFTDGFAKAVSDLSATGHQTSN